MSAFFINLDLNLRFYQTEKGYDFMAIMKKIATINDELGRKQVAMEYLKKIYSMYNKYI